MDSAALSLQTVLADVAGGILTITLNRPDKLNAWTYQMGAELRRLLLAANDDNSIDAMVVTGAGRAFCAGADIEMVFDAQSKAAPPYKDEAHTEDWVALVRRSKPIVAAINGAAIGVGLSQILPMDYLVCSSEAKLSLRFVKLGLVPELASSYFVVQRTGFGTASDLMLTGRTLTGAEAFELGLVDRLITPDALLETAQDMARAMGENPQAALAETKALLTRNASDPDLAAVQRREFEALDRCYTSAEHREAIDAFIGKRAPDFRRARIK